MNTFGTATQRFTLCDAQEVTHSRLRFRRDAIPLLARANRFYMPAGRWPFRGWLLLPRGDYDRLDRYSRTLELRIGDPTMADNVATLGNLSIVQARCVTRGLASDPTALYLVEITDGRGILCNRWFSFPTTSQYNLRAVAYPQDTAAGGTFFTNTLNSGSTWTWATMLQNLWQQMSTFLGPWPGLPAGADTIGTPEGYSLTGVGAWGALNDILDHLGLTIACNLTSTTPYTIVVSNATDVSFSALQTRYLPWLTDDGEYIDIGAGRVPATVKVFFRRRNAVYGTEETVRYDEYQWATTPLYTVSVAAPSTFSAASGTHYLWSDYVVRFDHNNQVVDVDALRATTIASARVASYYARINPGTWLEQTYAGALPFVTGSQVDGVCWYRGDGIHDRSGWRTQVISGPQPPWPGYLEW